MGFRLINVGSDVGFIEMAAKETLKKVGGLIERTV